MECVQNRCVRIGTAILAAALASGFIFPDRYKQAEPDVEAATLVITKTQAEREKPSTQEPTRYFNAYEDSSCSESGRGGFLGTLQAPSGDVLSKVLGNRNEISKEFRVAAGQRMYLKARSRVVLDSRRQSYKSRHCTNFVSFTPLEGHRYEAWQMSTDDRCLLLVIDSESERVPSDFEVVPIAGACHDD